MNESDFQRYINKLVVKRMIKAPLMNVARLVRLFFFQFTGDHKRLKKLKKVHEGKRCFIVGNGPSLTLEDLEKLKEEYSFGFNRIYELFDKTAWRPNYYMVLDNDVMNTVASNVETIDAQLRILNVMGKAKGIKSDDRTCFFCSYGIYRAKEFKFVKKSLSKDISKFVSLNFSVSAAAIEMAIYMGFKEIYLIGLDNNFSRWIDNKGKIHFSNVEDYKLINAHDFNYFCYQDAVNSCFEFYQKYALKNGIKILNATRGGNLNVFERVNFDDIM